MAQPTRIYRSIAQPGFIEWLKCPECASLFESYETPYGPVTLSPCCIADGEIPEPLDIPQCVRKVQ